MIIHHNFIMVKLQSEFSALYIGNDFFNSLIAAVIFAQIKQNIGRYCRFTIGVCIKLYNAGRQTLYAGF